MLLRIICLNAPGYHQRMCFNYLGRTAAHGNFINDSAEFSILENFGRAASTPRIEPGCSEEKILFFWEKISVGPLLNPIICERVTFKTREPFLH